MLKKEPLTFSSAFNISAHSVLAAGAVDVTLNCDTKLFIDPLLLPQSDHRHFSDCATAAYRARFELVIKLLRATRQAGDKAWDGARKQLTFPEMTYTHLGYSSGKSGSGFGSILTDSLLDSAKKVIDLGVEDPDIFVALALFEENVGADRISDMTSRIILECLVEFTLGVASALGLPTSEFSIPELGNRKYRLPANPLEDGKQPIVLVPSDIVRDLPIASDWDSVASAAQQTEDLRNRVNADIGAIWAAKTKAEKRAVKDRILSSKNAAELFLEILKNAADEPYDIRTDHNGEIYPADLRRQLATDFPLSFSQYSGKKLTPEEANEIVEAIISKYQELIEHNGLWKLLWNEKSNTPRREKAAQLLFFAMAHSYCDANDLDISPEADAGTGPVDFKFSSGKSSSIIVEIKKSDNPSLLDGYNNQLDTYQRSAGAAHAHYVVLDLGTLSKARKDQLNDARNAASAKPKGAPKIWTIDASQQVSASKRKTPSK